MTADDQAEVIRYLTEGDAFSGFEGPVERIDTHISIVFLAGDRVYKLKRAVCFDFVDFSTVDLRRAACDAEVRLNRRTAPALYLGVRAVTREADSSLAIDGVGAVLDWLVEMVRFDQASLFNRQVRAGRLGGVEMEQLATEIVKLHDRAAACPERGGAPDMAALTDQLEAGLATEVFDSASVDRLIGRLRRSRIKSQALLESRRETGFVRQCHGDLHLANICLVDGRATLFDCIEFNDDLACIDLLYDVAFPVMDLWHHGARDLANRLLNEYFGRTGDVGGMALMPLFLGCRAGVRAMVLALAARTDDDPLKAAATEQTARGYLAAAGRLAAPAPARLVAVGGLSGSRKSTLAHRAWRPILAALLGP